MKIAVTYDNGQIYQHFGMATCVKIYDVENGIVVSTEIVEMASPGHTIIGRVIFGHGASVVICGYIQPSAAGALEISGIELIAGVQGSADDAVAAYIDGSLKHRPEACTSDEQCGHIDEDGLLH